MKKQYSLRFLALAGVCLAPLAAQAQDFDLGDAPQAAAPAKQYTNEIDVGVRYQSSTSPLYGRYTGTDSKGFGSLGGFHLESTMTPASGAPLKVEATGTNLNFQPDHQGPNNALAPESEVNVSAGQQGIWKAGAYYNAITYTGQKFLTPYTASGNLAPGQQAFGGQTITGYTAAGVPILSPVPAAGAAGTAAYYVNHAFPEFQTTAGTRRDIGGVDGKYIIDAWTITTGFRHEHKEGTTLQTMYTSNAGIAFPQPVNYDTDRYNVTAAFNTRRLQAQLGYNFSKFSDNASFFTSPYLFATSATAQSVSVYSQPPSNFAHYVNGAAGYNLTPTTRITSNFQYGLEMSDGALGAGTATPLSEIGGAASAARLALNPGGDQMARVYNANLGVTSRPMAGLDVKVGYGIDGRENSSSPMTVYGNSHGDGAPALIGNILQQNWTKQKATLEAGYKVLPNTKVSVGYRLDDVHRSAGAVASLPMSSLGWVGHSTENTEWIKVSDHSLAQLDSSVTYEHAVRTGLMELAPGSGTVTNGQVQNSSMPFYEAPRTSDRVKLRADYMPADQWTIGANARYEANHYNYSSTITGTQRDYNTSAGPDITYSPTKAISLHGFYTYEEIYYVNRGNGVPSTLNKNYGWSAATTDSVHTAGVSADWQVSERLKVGAEYTFSYGDIGYNLYDGGLALNTATAASYYNVSNLPTIDSSMHSVKLRAEYKLTDAITLMGGYGFDMYKDNDWSYGWSPVMASNASGLAAPLGVNTFTSGENQSSYRVHSLYTALRLRF